MSGYSLSNKRGVSQLGSILSFKWAVLSPHLPSYSDIHKINLPNILINRSYGKLFLKML